MVYPAPSLNLSDRKGRVAPLVRRTLSAISGVAYALALPAILLGAWEWAGYSGLLPRGIIPTPSAVVSAWYRWAFASSGLGFDSYSGTWASNALYSAQRVAKGYLCAIVIGVPIGVFIGWSPLVARTVDPLLQSLRPIPITAWVPFTIALFGIRDMGAVFLIGLGAFYPILVNSTFGARDVNANLIRAARMLGATPRDILLRVVFPSALPAIFTGMRIGLGIAWAAVIIAEMIAVKSGLGYVLWDAYYTGNMDIVLADMATIGALGFLSDQLIVMLSRRVCGWKVQRA